MLRSHVVRDPDRPLFGETIERAQERRIGAVEQGRKPSDAISTVPSSDAARSNAAVNVSASDRRSASLCFWLSAPA
jgi:hypothetical protein